MLRPAPVEEGEASRLLVELRAAGFWGAKKAAGGRMDPERSFAGSRLIKEELSWSYLRSASELPGRDLGWEEVASSSSSSWERNACGVEARLML